MATTDGRFSDDERAAMAQRAAELREEAEAVKADAGKGAGRGQAKREREATACDEAIAALTGADREVAQALHAIVREVAPHLDPKTWYGFPSYARDGKVVVFYQPATKFGTRYGTVGFNEEALLDDGVMWPTSYAVLAVDEAVEKALRQLVSRAAG